MSKHKQNNDGIYFLGESSTDVTGSQYLVQFGGKKSLSESLRKEISKNDKTFRVLCSNKGMKISL